MSLVLIIRNLSGWWSHFCTFWSLSWKRNALRSTHYCIKYVWKERPHLKRVILMVSVNRISRWWMLF